MTAAEKLAKLVEKLTDDGEVLGELDALLEEVRGESITEFRTFFGARLLEMDEREMRGCGVPHSQCEDTVIGVRAGVRWAGEAAKDLDFDF